MVWILGRLIFFFTHFPIARYLYLEIKNILLRPLIDIVPPNTFNMPTSYFIPIVGVREKRRTLFGPW